MTITHVQDCDPQITTLISGDGRKFTIIRACRLVEVDYNMLLDVEFSDEPVFDIDGVTVTETTFRHELTDAFRKDAGE